VTPARRARRGLPLLLVAALLPLAVALEGCGGSGSRTVRRTAPAATRGCTDCHQPFVQSLAGRAAHFADLGTRCEDCHDRHGLVGVLKLKRDEPELCLQCHADTRAELAAGHPHGPLADGRCSDCHDPHAATPAGGPLLAAAGRELCLTCHDRAGFEGPAVHEPVAGDCSACHDAHVNATPGGLRAAVPGLCLSCHPADAPGFAPAHQGHDVSRSDCGSCHAPHVAQGPGLLKASVHPPLADNDCSSCHVEPAEATPGAAGPETIVESESLCLVCHSGEVGAFSARPVQHEVVVQGDCTSCHVPHASEHDKLLAAPAAGAALCNACHTTLADVGALAAARGRTHPPAAEGQCLQCHDPHGGHEALLRQPEPEACLSCHESVRAELGRSGVHQPAQDCSACHDGHGSQHLALLSAPPGEQCLSCHTELATRLRHEELHRPVSQALCLSCHEAHGSDHAALLTAAPAEQCTSCHAEAIARVKGGSAHPPAVDGECLSCHDPHASREPALLLGPAGSLCSACHGLTQEHIDTAFSAHPPAKAGACLACHAPHVAPREHLLDLAPRELCLQCHGEVLDEMTRPGHLGHVPAEEGQCLQCHDPHASAEPGLALQPVPALCLACHPAEAEPMPAAHLGRDLSGSDCLQCHAPHGGEGGLFWPNRHVPFAEKKCDECHADAK
jgi:predicted CXXCH cytochrome family protein